MKVKCIKNSIDSMTIQMPWIKVGKIYEVVSEHWSREDYLKNINMEEVNYKWVIGQGWVVESENGQLKLMVEETLKEVDRTINFQEYLDEYSK